MSKDKQKMKVKSTMSYDAVATLLDNLLESFRDGKVVLRQDDTFLVLQPGGSLEAEVEAKLKKGKQSLSLELSWSKPEPAQDEAPQAPAAEEEQVEAGAEATNEAMAGQGGTVFCMQEEKEIVCVNINE